MTYTDTFNRSTLGSNWAYWIDTGASIVSNELSNDGGSDTDDYVVWVGSGGATTSSHYVKATLVECPGPISGGSAGLLVRGDTSTPDSGWVGTSTYVNTTIWEVQAGAWASRATSSSLPALDGDVIRMQSTSTTLYVHNDSEMAQVVSYTSSSMTNLYGTGAGGRWDGFGTVHAWDNIVSGDGTDGTQPSGETAPSAVSDLAGTAGTGQVSLTWTAPSDGGSAITDYTVWYGVTG